MKKYTALLLAITMLLCMAVGCGGSPAGGKGSDGSPADSKGSDGSPADSKGSDGRPFRIATPFADIAGLYPYLMQMTRADALVDSLIYEPLVKAVGEDKQVELCLAEDYSYNEDQSELIFHLRKGVKFHDGTEMKASDVVFSYNHYCDESSDGPFVGISGIRSDDDYTVVFEVDFPYVATIPGELERLFIISEAHFDKVGGADGYAENPIGTGAYQFVSWEKNAQVNFKAFDDYYRGTPSIQDVQVVFMTDVSARMNAVEVGDIDYARLDSTALKLFKDDERITLVMKAAVTAPGVMMNEMVPEFADVRVRQAIAYALNREQMVAAVFPDGGAQASSIWVPSSISGYSEDVPTYEYDLEKARALLAEAGYPDGLDAGSLLCASGNTAAQVVQEQLAQIGITCELQTLDSSAFYKQLGVMDYSIAAVAFGVEGSHVADAASLFSTEGELNWTGYSNPEMDKLFEEIAMELDPQRVESLSKEIGTILQEDVPWIRYYEAKEIIGITSDVEGYRPVSIGVDMYNLRWK